MELESRIPEKLFFKIGEVCELIKVQPHVLRYWETEFPMLAPQKNRAGQRVYRRKDVEMVMRIRDLLYEEKFTIAGAKKKLQDELRSSSRTRQTPRETPPVEAKPVAASPVETPSVEAPPDPPALEAREPEPPLAHVPQTPALETSISPQARRAFRVIKRDLEDLLTLLNADASINR
jgi:DNA-binding transcriptional MerR regulator